MIVYPIQNIVHQIHRISRRKCVQSFIWNLHMGETFYAVSEISCCYEKQMYVVKMWPIDTLQHASSQWQASWQEYEKQRFSGRKASIPHYWEIERTLDLLRDAFVRLIKKILRGELAIICRGMKRGQADTAHAYQKEWTEKFRESSHCDFKIQKILSKEKGTSRLIYSYIFNINY